MSGTARSRPAWTVIGYLLVAIAGCLTLAWLAASITSAHLLRQAQQQLSDVAAGKPLWQWPLREPHDLIAGKAFGNATVARDDGALRITSEDGSPFELGLPVAWWLDLRHWPILHLQLQSSAAGMLGLIWQDEDAHSCLALTAHALTPDMQSLRIDLRDLSWQSDNGSVCAVPGIARMLRVRVQLPRHGSLSIRSAELLTAEPFSGLPAAISIPSLGHHFDQLGVRGPMPLFRLPEGSSAEWMLKLRDQLRARWPAALIVPAGSTVEAQATAKPRRAVMWIGCALYLIALAWLVGRPLHGKLRPWVEITGCLLGPLWLIMGLHWGLRPTALGAAALGGGMAFALAIERRHLSRMWRWPKAKQDWLWPLALVPVAALLILFGGHTLGPLAPMHVVAYFGWAWLQQWLMLVVLLPRFEQALRRPELATLAVALVFALMHTPNGMLMQLCFIGELWWVNCFQRSRSVLPIALAHATCALLAESGLIGGMLRSLEVSARFFF